MHRFDRCGGWFQGNLEVRERITEEDDGRQVRKQEGRVVQASQCEGASEGQDKEVNKVSK